MKKVSNTQGSQRDKAGLAICDADDKYRSILEDAPVGMYQATAEGRIVYANTAFADMLGYKGVDEMILASADDLCAMYRTATDRDNHLEFIYSGSSGATMDMRLARRGSGAVWVSVQSRGVRDKHGKPLYHDAFVIDITEKKSLQAEAVRASQLASLGELAAGVAHEINNPLNAVINLAQLLEDEPEGHGRMDLLERIQRESNRIAAIVRNLLSFARAEDEEFSPVSLVAVIEDSLGLTRAQMEKEGVLITVDIPEDAPMVRGRFQELQQVCVNLFNNARYALTERWPDPCPGKTLDITASFSTGVVELRVRDQGTGIAPEALESVTDPFFSTKPKGVGTGLGLSISGKIVKSHGGTLKIESEPGRYTEVTVGLPVWKGDTHGQDPDRG